MSNCDCCYPLAYHSLVGLEGSSTAWIPRDSDWIDIASSPGSYGRSKKFAGVLSDGSLWCWGEGPVGDGTPYGSAKPVRVSQQGERWTSVSINDNGAFLAIKEDGSLWAWGASREQCGLRPFADGTTGDSGLRVRARIESRISHIVGTQIRLFYPAVELPDPDLVEARVVQEPDGLLPPSGTEATVKASLIYGAYTSSIEILDGGYGYKSPPSIAVKLRDGSSRSPGYDSASLTAEINQEGVLVAIRATGGAWALADAPFEIEVGSAGEERPATVRCRPLVTGMELPKILSRGHGYYKSAEHKVRVEMKFPSQFGLGAGWVAVAEAIPEEAGIAGFDLINGPVAGSSARRTARGDQFVSDYSPGPNESISFLSSPSGQTIPPDCIVTYESDPFNVSPSPWEHTWSPPYAGMFPLSPDGKTLRLYCTGEACDSPPVIVSALGYMSEGWRFSQEPPEEFSGQLSVSDFRRFGSIHVVDIDLSSFTSRASGYGTWGMSLDALEVANSYHFLPDIRSITLRFSPVRSVFRSVRVASCSFSGGRKCDDPQTMVFARATCASVASGRLSYGPDNSVDSIELIDTGAGYLSEPEVILTQEVLSPALLSSERVYSSCNANGPNGSLLAISEGEGYIATVDGMKKVPRRRTLRITDPKSYEHHSQETPTLGLYRYDLHALGYLKLPRIDVERFPAIQPPSGGWILPPSGGWRSPSSLRPCGRIGAGGVAFASIGTNSGWLWPWRYYPYASDTQLLFLQEGSRHFFSCATIQQILDVIFPDLNNNAATDPAYYASIAEGLDIDSQLLTPGTSLSPYSYEYLTGYSSSGFASSEGKEIDIFGSVVFPPPGLIRVSSGEEVSIQELNDESTPLLTRRITSTVTTKIKVETVPVSVAYRLFAEGSDPVDGEISVPSYVWAIDEISSSVSITRDFSNQNVWLHQQSPWAALPATTRLGSSLRYSDPAELHVTSAEYIEMTPTREINHSDDWRSSLQTRVGRSFIPIFPFGRATVGPGGWYSSLDELRAAYEEYYSLIDLPVVFRNEGITDACAVPSDIEFTTTVTQFARGEAKGGERISCNHIAGYQVNNPVARPPGYISPPDGHVPVSAINDETDSEGYGFSAIAKVENGEVVSIDITDGGFGYTGRPRLSVGGAEEIFGLIGNAYATKTGFSKQDSSEQILRAMSFLRPQYAGSLAVRNGGVEVLRASFPTEAIPHFDQRFLDASVVRPPLMFIQGYGFEAKIGGWSHE